jgi:GST-like protein
MSLENFAITGRWPPSSDSAIQLYSLPTPNGIKASAVLEESGLDYDAHLISFETQDQKSPEFLSLNPNGKIPAILDPNGPEGTPMGLWESGAILHYIATKAGVLLPASETKKLEALQWVFFQVGGVGPMMGQFGHFFKFADQSINHDYATARYRDESRRLLQVLEQQLTGRDYIVGKDYSIADLSIWPWIRTLHGFYQATEALGLNDFPRVNDWLGRCQSRPASQAAVNIPARD